MVAPASRPAVSRSLTCKARMTGMVIETSSSRGVRMVSTGGSSSAWPPACGRAPDVDAGSATAGAAMREVLEEVELGEDAGRPALPDRHHRGGAAGEQRE